MRRLTWFLAAVIGLSMTAAGCSSSGPAQGALRTAGPGVFAPTIPAAASGSLSGLLEPTVNGSPESSPAADLPQPQITVIPSTPTLFTDTPRVTLRQLTSNECCVQPFWSPDSQTVLFLDRPDPSQPTGIWGIGRGGGAASLITDRIGVYSRDLRLRAFWESGQTVIERLEDGVRAVIPNGGRSVSFSPSGEWVAWTSGQSGPPLDSAQRQIWISRWDGTASRQVITITGGGFSGWLTDQRILINGRPEGSVNEQVLWTLDLPDGEPPVTTAGPAVELVRTERLRGTAVSPDGNWIVYLVTFSADSAQDGLWLADTRTGERRKLDLFGAYRWRDSSRLLVIPLEPGSASNRMWQIDTAGGPPVPLTDPSTTPFQIAGGDWSVAPNGSAIVFVSAADSNLWLMELP